MSLVRSAQAFACAAALCAAIQPAPAGAVTLSAVALPGSPAMMAARASVMLSSTAPAALSSSRAAPGAIDVTPPALTGFAITPPADVAAPFAQIRVNVTATDDLSGVSSFSIALQGPHGQVVYAYPAALGMPLRHFTGHTAIDTTAYMEPGVWKALYAYVWDAEGNQGYVDQAGLALLGSIDVTLTSSRPDLADVTPPVVRSGAVDTPTVSVSSHRRGTDTASPLFHTDFTVSDPGSGVHWLSAVWCLADGSSCLSSSAGEAIRDVGHKILRAIGSLPPTTLPGTYLLQSMSVEDYAQNSTYLLGTEFGGTTDFGHLMPGGHAITVTP
jgi:hypothetical protein